MPETTTDPVFGTHTTECHAMGWYLLDWDSECLRPSTVTAPLTESQLADLDVRSERTQDAAQ